MADQGDRVGERDGGLADPSRFDIFAVTVTVTERGVPQRYYRGEAEQTRLGAHQRSLVPKP